MRAMILAAGRGARMRPLTDHQPKPLLQAGHQSLIGWQIEKLADAGINEIMINHAWLGEQIEQALGDGRQWGVRLYYSPEGEALDTGGGIFRALAWLGHTPFIVVNADVWCDISLASLPQQPDGLAHLVLVDNPPHHQQGDFTLCNGQVRADGTQRLTFSGIGIYHPVLFANCNPGNFSLIPVLLQAMAQQQVSGEHYRGDWRDIGTPQRLQQLNNSLHNT